MSPLIAVLAVLIVLLTLVAAGLGAILFTRYTWVAGGFREKGDSVLDLRGENISLSQYQELTQAFPGREILWRIPFRSGAVSSDASQAAVSSLSDSDWQALELMDNLTLLDASGCRDYDRLLDFQARHPQCQVQYRVFLDGTDYPNDAQFLSITNGNAAALAEVLPYLPQVTQVEFTGEAPSETAMDSLCAAFPIAETAITDLSPLSCLKNLVFLEIFTTKITDYSPLLGCTALEDLNLGKTYGDPGPILQMTWLKNLWWSGIEGSHGLPCSDAPQRLRETLTNTTMKFNLETPKVNNGWRQLDNYCAMRDLMEVFYLT